MDIEKSGMLQVYTIPPKENMVRLNHVKSFLGIRTIDGSAVTAGFFFVRSSMHTIAWAQGIGYPCSEINVGISLSVLFLPLVTSLGQSQAI